MRSSQICGLSGLSLIGLGAVIGLFGYHGLSGHDRYSILNHFISELGNAEKSKYAYAFNRTLVVGGLLLACSVPTLSRGSGWAAAMLTTATMGLALVGLFPENVNPAAHLTAAGLVSITSVCGVASSARAMQRELGSRWRGPTPWLSLATVILFALLMTMPKSLLIEGLFFGRPGAFARPPLWWLAIFEWLYFSSFAAWIGASLLTVPPRGKEPRRR